MTEWVEATLGEHLTRVRRKVSVADGMTYPAASVQMYGRGLGEKAPFVGGESKYKTLFKVRENDVVLRTITAFEAPAAVARAEHDGTHVSGVFITYEVTDDALPEYLTLYFQTPAFWGEMNNRASGTVLRRKTISDSVFQAIPINLPPLPVQERIVEVIGAVDDQIAALDGEAEAGATARAALLTDLLAGADETWTKTTIGDVVTFANGYAFPPKYQGGVEGTPFLKVSDMNTPGNEVTMSAANNRVNDDVLAQMRAKVHPAGTVVFAKVGAALLTEKRRVLGQPSAFDNNVMGLIATENVLPMFLYNVMLTVRLGDLAQQGAVPSVNQSHLRSVKVNLPPEATQERIVDVLSTFDNRIAATRAEAERLRAVRASLLSSLLTPPGEPGHISVEMIEKEAVGG